MTTINIGENKAKIVMKQIEERIRYIEKNLLENIAEETPGDAIIDIMALLKLSMEGFASFIKALPTETKDQLNEILEPQINIKLDNLLISFKLINSHVFTALSFIVALEKELSKITNN